MKRLKKALFLLLTVALALQTSACGGNKKLTEITVEEAPAVKSFVGEDVVFESMGTIKLHYSKGTEIVAITEEMLSPIDKNSESVQLITVTYRGFTDTFELTLNKRGGESELQGIEIFEAPVVKSFVRQDLEFASPGKLKLKYASGAEYKDITTDMLSMVDIYSAAEQEITVTYLEKTATFKLTLLEDLTTGKASALAVVESAYKAYIQNDYTASAWTELTAAYEKGKTDIAGAANAADITAAKNIALSAMTLVRRKDEGGSTVAKYFGLDWSNGQSMVQDEDGTITVTYNGVAAGATWAPFSTAQGFELNHDFPAQNAYQMTVKNEGTHEISFVLSLKTNTDPTKPDDGVEVGRYYDKIAAGATEEIVVSLSDTARQVLIFVDNDRAHTDSGRVVISDYGFTTAQVPTAQDFKTEAAYTITDKDGVLANVVYTDMPANSFGLITHAASGFVKEKNKISITVKNNGAAAVRYSFNAGTFVGGALKSCINVHSGYDGVSGYIPANETVTIVMVVDYDGTAYPDATPPAANAVPTDYTFFIDSCYWEEEFAGQTRSGNIDFVSIETSAYAA